ncbi:uncharacterized protein LOC106873286 [Octopus bimaculoides]|uniref:Uncharacterized protein n=1 Tax=Octopus bimaculoides TaxID=37653 RepID=A0A0L8H2G7_OCTBM|nr:uncharacterized protein LOC106873286 [Octopus bimaculoides]|eukprot:XP_014776078.1 PREDICTED: uncharacterized protein LOC106873286 [Octopus bimaculoides]
MSTTGIEVRRPYPSVATIWVAELLAAANKKVDDVENRKTYESINKMFGKSPSNHEAVPMSLEDKFTHKIIKHKRKLEQKEKEVENAAKKRKKKADTISNSLSKTELIAKKKKTPNIVNGTKSKSETNSVNTVENIKLRLEKDTLSRSARKKLRRKLKGLLNKSNDSTQCSEEGERKNKTSNNLIMEKVKETINNYHKAASSTPKMNGHHIEVDKTTNTVNKNGRSNIYIHNKKQNCSQTQTKEEASAVILKKKKKKRSKQKNLKKDNRPDHLKPFTNQVKSLNQKV